MFCRKCGNSIPSDSEFCPVCGYTTVAVPEAVQLQPQPPSFDLPFEVAPNSETNDKTNNKSAKSPSSKKKKKIILAVVSSVLAVALIVTGCFMIPELKRKAHYALLKQVSAHYVAGNYGTAKKLAARLNGEYGDYPAQGKAVIRFIEFRESLIGWSGTGEELLDMLEEFYNDIHAIGYTPTYFLPNISSIDFYNGSSDNVLNYLIPGLRSDFEALPELTSAMETFFESFYRLIYKIVSLYGQSGFYYSDAQSIDSDMADAFETAYAALNALQSRYPKSSLLADCIECIDICHEHYESLSESFLFDITYVDGYKSLSYSENTDEKTFLKAQIGIDKALFVFCSEPKYYGYECSADELSEYKNEKYQNLSQPSYFLVCFVNTLLADIDIEIIEGAGIKSVEKIISDSYSKYVLAS